MPEAKQNVPSLERENMEAGEWEGTEGGRLWRSQCCHAVCCLVPYQQPRKSGALFPVICATSFLLLPRYLPLFYSTPMRMGDVKGNGGVFLCLITFLSSSASSCRKVPDTRMTHEKDRIEERKGAVWGKCGNEGHAGSKWERSEERNKEYVDERREMWAGESLAVINECKSHRRMHILCRNASTFPGKWLT